MKYRVVHDWAFDTLDEDVGVVFDRIKKEMDFPEGMSPESVLEQINQQLDRENPRPMRRSYRLISVVRIDQEEKTTQIF